ncbi:probable leucine-rich repeat receptor-like protein kinase At2g28990 [Cucurbita moschata]|uniref:Probable leucine-rich repeat receptor-like protein kinase At2g28990 n=1 Tax=Cucurbita moschata TaxID=3662 RepID=A0A6J1FQZ6_CUCMO|nr:probable leucine-rich repeat receptor-like protein kinase At2g28990 [Cucurbita moschata]
MIEDEHKLIFLFGAVNSDDWVSIDCGSEDFLIDGSLVTWDTDDLYTDAGINQKIRTNKDKPLEILTTLRFFPSSKEQSCYKLPIYDQNLRYLVRSGFLYGNYDGLNRPPAFDLLLDGKKMSKIEPASATETIFDELVYTSKRSGFMNLCLAQRKDGGIPFISSIQAVPTGDDLYAKMKFNETFRVVTRINYGNDDGSLSSSDDNYERIWTLGTTPPNCNAISAIPDFESPENDPPSFVLDSAIESVNASSPIILTVDFSNASSASQSAYFVLYFTEEEALFDDKNRTIDIFIDGQKLSTITTSVERCTVVTLYPIIVRTPTVNVTLSAANSSAGSPPLISAMEVFVKVIPTGGASSLQFPFFSFILMLSVCVFGNLL